MGRRTYFRHALWEMRAAMEGHQRDAMEGHWRDVRAFFRSGATGEWRARLSAADLAAYEARVAGLVW